MKILVLDHNRPFGDTLKVGLKAAGGHSVDAYATSAEALEALGRERYALALVEYSQDGRAFLYQYRSIDPLLVVVVLTSLPTQETTAEFLRGGSQALAVDYIAKPAPDLIRQLSDIINDRFARVTVGDWAVERRLRRATYQGRPLTLTPTEMSLITYFMMNPYQTVQHETLWLAARGEAVDHAVAVQKLRTVISRLRDKLEDAAGREIIQSVREGGFRFLPQGVGVAGEWQMR